MLSVQLSLSKWDPLSLKTDIQVDVFCSSLSKRLLPLGSGIVFFILGYASKPDQFAPTTNENLSDEG